MFFRRKRSEEPRRSGAEQPSGTNSVQCRDAGKIAVRDVTDADKPVRRSFPGPRGAQAPLRVAIDRSAQAELIAHAKESLSAEICGVLAGQICEDDEGAFVHVEAVIRGTAASQGSTHVTFTQATWNAIYQVLERDHPKLRIVGWYHSHPGFGVEFSEMDLFIQRNFFSGAAQIALVTDPVNGAVAICRNTPHGIEYLPRFWVEGREQSCQTPSRGTAAATTGEIIPAISDDASRRLQELESRVGALVLALDEQRTSLYRFLLFAGMMVAMAIVVVAGYGIYLQLKARVEPPKNVGFAPVPVQVGGHTALLGVQVVSWQLPPELDVVQQAFEQLKRELEKQLGTNLSAIISNLPAGTNSLPASPASNPLPPKPALPGKASESP